MRSESVTAFDLDDEPAAIRDAYGRNGFGPGCLLARRLVERGCHLSRCHSTGRCPDATGLGHTPEQFRHGQATLFDLDSGWATLLEGLGRRGLLESTLVIWMGELVAHRRSIPTGAGTISPMPGRRGWPAGESGVARRWAGRPPTGPRWPTVRSRPVTCWRPFVVRWGSMPRSRTSRMSVARSGWSIPGPLWSRACWGRTGD
ncbi:MAG: hypothetical protein CM1200mP2_16170 [Planctomycetaceae bacterium]|nr:MAG: hypothetical protein CM1200mP2_16170 [Planctomycetaceae bacterium]